MNVEKPVEAADLPYRRCVGIMVLNRDGKVWTGRRIGKNNTEAEGAGGRWQMPQGGIDEGEKPLAAARRELFEETGMKSVTLLDEAPDWITYDLPAELVGIALKGKYRGQTQRWFAFRFTGEESEIRINPPPGGHKAEFDDWTWVDMETLPELIVEFKKPLYRDVVAAFRHLTHS